MQRKYHIILLTLGLCLVAGLLAFLAVQGLRIDCLFHKLTGLYCPGCGNTRATLCLLNLEFGKMLRYNLLYPLEMLYCLRIYITCSRRYLQGQGFRYRAKPDWIDISFLVLLLVWAILRNLLPIFALP